MKTKHKANLLKLADYLATLPDNYEQFDMTSYMAAHEEGYWETFELEERSRPADIAGDGGELKNLFTLADARKHHACEDGYDRFKVALRKAYPDATDLDTIRWSIGDVARVDLEDALWCLCMVEDTRTRVAAIMPAVKRAAKHTTDERVHWSISEIDRWMAGDDTVDLEAAAYAATEAAAYAATEAAAAAARVAAWAASTATEAARAAAWAARAARRAARTATEAAAEAAEAARATVEAAARAARAAADAAAEAAADAEKDNQRADLIAMFPPTLKEPHHDH